MTDEEIREGDIVEIDYIAFTKEHINEGKALVIWKGFNQQPLVRKFDTKTTIWTCYEHISKVVGHIDIEGYMDKALEKEPYEKFENVKDHIYKLASDYKCWDNRLTDDEAIELCHILEQEPILDKIRAEMHATAEKHEDGCYYLREEWIDEIIDKYRK